MDAEEEKKSRREREGEFRRRLGARVRELRTAQGMSQERLALAANLTQFQISGIERGARNPSSTTLWALAGAFGMTLAQFLEEVD